MNGTILQACLRSERLSAGSRCVTVDATRDWTNVVASCYAGLDLTQFCDFDFYRNKFRKEKG
jgi:hypothetical protein